MTFQEYFQQVKARFLGADISAVSDPCLLYTSRCV